MKNMRFGILISVLSILIVLVACSGSDDSDQEIAVAIALTQTAVPSDAVATELPPASVEEITPQPEPPTAEASATEAAVASEPEPEMTGTDDCPVPSILTDQYGADILNDHHSYRNELDQYCFRYPPTFRVADELTGVQLGNDQTGNVVSFHGPPLDESQEPVAAALFVSVTEAASDDLVGIVDQYAATITYASREQMLVNGTPAEVLYGVPNRMEQTQLFMLHNGRLYQLNFGPTNESMSQAEPDLMTLMNAALQTWTFLE